MQTTLTTWLLLLVLTYIRYAMGTIQAMPVKYTSFDDLAAQLLSGFKNADINIVEMYDL